MIGQEIILIIPGEFIQHNEGLKLCWIIEAIYSNSLNSNVSIYELERDRLFMKKYCKCFHSHYQSEISLFGRECTKVEGEEGIESFQLFSES